MGQEIVRQEIVREEIARQEIVPREVVPSDRPASNGLHPYVYAGVAALAIWFVLAVWWGFASNGYTDFLLFVVSGFILTFVAFALVLSRVSRGDDADADGAPVPPSSFRGWASKEFDTWQYRLKGGHAAAEVLLPIAAIAFGMTAIGIVAHVVSHGAI